MGHIPNGQHGPHYPPPQPHWALPHYAPPNGNGHNLARGYLPLMIAIPVTVAIAAFAFQVGSVWTKQQVTIEAVQQDVTRLTAGQERVETKLTTLQTTVQKALERTPWSVEVKEARR